MTNSDITDSLGNYIINPLPDIEDEDSGDYYVHPDLSEEVFFGTMDIQEIKRQSMIDAMEMFEAIYNNNNFLIGLGDSRDTGQLDYVFYTSLIEGALQNLDELEQIIQAIVYGNNETEISILDYLYTDFKTDILSD